MVAFLPWVICVSCGRWLLSGSFGEPPLVVFVTHVHKALVVVASPPRLACVVFFFLPGCLYTGLPLLFLLSYHFLVGRVLASSVSILITLSSLVRITLRKLFNCDVGIFQVAGWIPNVIMFRRVASPLSFVLELTSAIESEVNYFVKFIFGFAFSSDWRWRFFSL